MKPTIGLTILIFYLTLNLQAKKKEATNLFGDWKLIKAETNGMPNPQIMMNRTFKYSKNGLLEGKVFLNGEEKPFNSGMFFLPNDSTMICIHFNPDNKLSSLSYTYNFHVKNDSLHLYGVYFSRVQNKRNLLQMNYINEWWIKSKASGKK